jgi:hypothetical protein
MSKISNTTAYPIITPTANDYVILTDVNDNNATKTCTVDSLKGSLTGGEQTITKTFTSAEILTSGTLPIKVLECSVGEFIIVNWALLVLDFNSVAYNNASGMLVLNNGNNVSTLNKAQLGWNWPGLPGLTSAGDYTALAGFPGGNVEPEFPLTGGGNTLYLGSHAVNPTLGNSPITIKIGYNIATF